MKWSVLLCANESCVNSLTVRRTLQDLESLAPHVDLIPSREGAKSATHLLLELLLLASIANEQLQLLAVASAVKTKSGWHLLSLFSMAMLSNCWLSVNDTVDN
ncbi:hypothetical protein Q31a_13760 [Aureliella helgolandensis]|uniref:Uncharacterized protein n=1 Tax=Aureliella helgolandensis TaxID=2527968 RepID=A0A518G396_9BACT|nr:hypothetical protein Q31a_13760 [Aureliella helgolandensis]